MSTPGLIDSCEETCARCVLRAFYPEMTVSSELYSSLSSFYNGLGIGSLCCGLIGGLMAIGLSCGENERLAREKSLQLMQYIQEKCGSLYCPRLRSDADACHALLEDIITYTKNILSSPSPPLSTTHTLYHES